MRSHGGDALGLGLVRKHGAGGDVADGVDPVDAGAVVLVDGDESGAVALDAGFLQAEAIRVRPSSAHGHEHAVALDGGGLVVLPGLQVQAHPVGAGLGPRGPRRQVELQALALEGALQLPRDLAVGAGQHGVQVLHHLHLGAETAPDRAHLEADGAGADDRHSLRDGVEGQGLLGAEDALPVEGQVGQLRPARSRWPAARGRPRSPRRPPPRPRPAAARRASPSTYSTPLLLKRVATPLVMRPTMTCLCFIIAARSRRRPPARMPWSSRPSCSSTQRWLASSRALLGMQPACRQVPPSQPRSTQTTFMPSVGGSRRRRVAAGAGADDDEVAGAAGQGQISRARRAGSSRSSLTRHQEAHRLLAVDEAVVVGQGQVHHRSDGDLAVDGDGAVLDERACRGCRSGAGSGSASTSSSRRGRRW